MNILITNDDGISCKGILALETVFKRKYNTFLIAPLRERSVTSMALSVIEKLRVEKVYEDHYIVDGYPVDCVNIGLHGNIFPEIDVVISGINRGVNMGNDVHYSGTVGAARHGAIHGLYAFSVSSGKMDDKTDYLQEAEMFFEFFENQIHNFKKGLVYNFNFPVKYKKSQSEFRLAKLGKRTYIDHYQVTSLVGNISEFYLGGSQLGFVDTEGTDFFEFNRNRIPLTPLFMDVTDYTEYNALKDRLHG